MFPAFTTRSSCLPTASSKNQVFRHPSNWNQLAVETGVHPASYCLLCASLRHVHRGGLGVGLCGSVQKWPLTALRLRSSKCLFTPDSVNSEPRPGQFEELSDSPTARHNRVYTRLGNHPETFLAALLRACRSLAGLPQHLYPLKKPAQTFAVETRSFLLF